MAFYDYKCTNEECKTYEEKVSISKPMSESAREEFCKECSQELARIYGNFGHQTFGDGYKS